MMIEVGLDSKGINDFNEFIMIFFFYEYFYVER